MSERPWSVTGEEWFATEDQEDGSLMIGHPSSSDPGIVPPQDRAVLAEFICPGEFTRSIDAEIERWRQLRAYDLAAVRDIATIAIAALNGLRSRIGRGGDHV